MCCKVSVAPLVPEIATAILTTGQFVLTSGEWVRLVPEENTRVTARLDTTMLSVTVAPSISSMEHHAGRRIAGAIMFEIAAKYSEKVNGTITHLSNIGECLAERGSGVVIARHPQERFDWSRICLGFRRVWLGADDATQRPES